MTPEQVKEKLEGVKWINKEIEGLYLELAALESGIIKKQELSTTRVQTSRVNTAENNLISVLKLKEDTLQRIERLTEERMEISRLIDKLANPFERSVLRLFYLNILDAWQIAEKIDKSKTTVYRVKQEAIEHLSKVEGVRREIFANLFTKRTGERLKLWQLYEALDIDKAEYERLKAEILLDFAKSYHGGVLLRNIEI